MMRSETRIRSDGAMYGFGHGFAWVLALMALTLGGIGILRGFGMLGAFAELAEEAGATETATVLRSTGVFWDGVVWMLPAIAIGLVAYAMHGAGHGYDRAGTAASKTEYGLGYILALGTLAAAGLALLVGFDVLGRGYTQFDGILWGFLGIVGGTLTAAMLGIAHAAVTDEDYLVTLVEQRVRGGTTTTARATELVD